MARRGKLTIFLSTGVNTSTINVTSTGVIGSVPINLTKFTLNENHAISGADSDTVWKAVVALVAAHLA